MDIEIFMQKAARNDLVPVDLGQYIRSKCQGYLLRQGPTASARRVSMKPMSRSSVVSSCTSPAATRRSISGTGSGNL